MKNSTKKLLIVEDDSGLRDMLCWCFDGYEIFVAEDREAALLQLRLHAPPIVLLDLGLPPDPANISEGLRALEQIQTLAPTTKIIVVTGNDGRENALRAVAMGAYDFYEKPVDADVLKLLVDRAYNLHALEYENRELLTRQAMTTLNGVIAGSAEMLKICRSIEKVAATQTHVLLQGESGVGKGLLARALHELSPRGKSPFVAVNCAAITDVALQNELFGYEKGAFDGATRQVRGKIEYAHGGTLLLDEVGDLPPLLQAKVLRFLQERVIERVGGRKLVPVDVRVVCTTHRDMVALVGEGAFRQDLYSRISEVAIQVPPLREREGDVLLIARKLLNLYGQQLGRPRLHFALDVLQALEAHPWPGNVRELENRLKRAVISSESDQITARDLELEAGEVSTAPFDLRHARERAERQALQQALVYTNSNVSRAADLLGITRPTLYTLMSKHNLKL